MGVKQFFQGIIFVLCIVLMGGSADNDDKYRDFEDLSQQEEEGIDYEINNHSVDSNILIMAIHGGSIEPGTSELARAISQETFDCYNFAGIKQTNNYDLHVSSLEFDEPKAVKLVQGSEHTVSIHGYESENKNTYVGGVDRELTSKIKKELQKNGFRVTESPEKYAGEEKANITNRNKPSKGVQLEISADQRKAFFEKEDFKTDNRKNKTDEFYDYAEAVKQGIKNR